MALAVDETLRVEARRAQLLEDAGFDRGAALELACRPDVDVHALIGWLAAGCPRATALRILRPDE